jgi:transcriptional regulator with XRE-family HTH domain
MPLGAGRVDSGREYAYAGSATRIGAAGMAAAYPQYAPDWSRAVSDMIEFSAAENTSNSLLAAAEAGRIGEVVRLGRQAQRLTQKELAEKCAVSQSTISRIERSSDVRDVKILRVVARTLQFPFALVGLAEPTGSAHRTPSSESSVNRREFLGLAAAAVAAVAMPTDSDQSLNAIGAITAAQRALDGDTPSRDLAESVTAHLHLASRKRADALDPLAQRTTWARISEIAGFSGWLHWDMNDLGSARAFYSTAIKASARTKNATLYAYMLGSLAALAVYGLFVIKRGDCLTTRCSAWA